MKEITLGYDAKTGAAETLHTTDDGRLGMSEGDWLYGAFKRRAKYLTRKNGFCEDDWRQMEALALAEILFARDRYDASKAKSARGHKAYLNTIVGNALGRAAKAVADERSVWRSRQSLDAPLGDGDDGTTHGDGVTAVATWSANAKLWSEPRCRVAARMLAEVKRDEQAKRRLLERLRCEAETDGAIDCSDGDAEDGETPCEESSSWPGHDKAVAEMGLSDDADEAVEVAGGAASLAGFGDCAASVYENTLRLDVAIAMNGLEPRLGRWCRMVLDGYSPVEAYRAMRISKSNFYAFFLPKLRTAFAPLRYAL